MEGNNDYFLQHMQELKNSLNQKIDKHKKDVVDSQQYQQEIKLLDDFSWDMIESIRHISLYSTRAKYIYDEFLTIRATDDILQSVLAIRDLLKDGIFNIAKREIRYLIEMVVKYLVVDQEKPKDKIGVKIQYLASDIPNSSIEVVDRMCTAFNADLDKQMKDEIKDLFYKSCAYVHPSPKQINEQLSNYSKGIHVGFETAKMLTDINKLCFRTYDIILSLLFVGFGMSMSGDLFIEIYDNNPKWKFHKGKYVSQFSKLYDYKLERQKKKNNVD